MEEGEQAQALGYGYPSPPTKDSQYKFFRDIIHSDDSTKVANLSNTELGLPHLSVRTYQTIGNYAASEDLQEVSEYLYKKAEIINSTSMAKKGFLSQLFVTQIKKDQKIKAPDEKKSWFSSQPKETPL